MFEGQVVSIHGVEDADPNQALRWIAYAWQNRDKLDRPCGLIYRRLQKRSFAPAESDISKLPGIFLQRLGISLPAPEGESRGEDVIEQPVDIPDTCPALDESQNGTMTPREAWQEALKQLEADMPRASFETWVRDTAPVYWEANIAEQQATLQVAARNAYARDWLVARLLDTVSQLLSEIFDWTVEVRFVVARGVSAETEG